MSYSVGAQGATKAEAITAINAQLDGVLEYQAIHKADIEQAKAAAAAFVAVLPDPSDTEQVSVTVSGSVGWTGALDEDYRITSASCNVGAQLTVKA